MITALNRLPDCAVLDLNKTKPFKKNEAYGGNIQIYGTLSLWSCEEKTKLCQFILEGEVGEVLI